MSGPEIKTERRGGYRAGAGRPKGSRSGKALSNAHKDAIALGQIENLLAKQIAGEIKLSNEQLEAIKIRYSRLRPTLAAVEQTVHDERDTKDASQLAQRLASMFNEKPELFEQVVALKNSHAAQQTSAETSDKRVTH